MLHGGNHPSITKHATMITWPHMQCWCKICLAWYRMRVWNLCCCTQYLINISSLYYNEYSVANKVFGTEGCSMENCIFPIYQRYSLLRASVPLQMCSRLIGNRFPIMIAYDVLSVVIKNAYAIPQHTHHKGWKYSDKTRRYILYLDAHK